MPDMSTMAPSHDHNQAQIQSFEQLVRQRRATRQFLPTPLAQAQIEAVLRDA